jgi:hypothetical protein
MQDYYDGSSGICISEKDLEWSDRTAAVSGARTFKRTYSETWLLIGDTTAHCDKLWS